MIVINDRGTLRTVLTGWQNRKSVPGGSGKRSPSWTPVEDDGIGRLGSEFDENKGAIGRTRSALAIAADVHRPRERRLVGLRGVLVATVYDRIATGPAGITGRQQAVVP